MNRGTGEENSRRIPVAIWSGTTTTTTTVVTRTSAIVVASIRNDGAETRVCSASLVLNANDKGERERERKRDLKKKEKKGRNERAFFLGRPWTAERGGGERLIIC